ncbi:MAG: Na(+)-translocating NADH-quinone reductase subunit C [Acidobacteriota bacterium]
MQRDSSFYIILFSAILCVVCAVMVSSTAVGLKDLQEANEALDEQRNVLEAAGLIEPGDKPTAEEVDEMLANAEVVLVDVQTGEETEVPGIDPKTYDPLAAKNDPELSYVAPKNNANIDRVAKYARVYKVNNEAGELQKLVLPVEGYGLWGTLYGFLALESDMNTVAGLTFYKHKETPGLGGEVDNPRWKSRWPGRKIYGPDGIEDVEIEVIKGAAGPVESEPYEVDGLSGATITGRGITNMLDFWLGSRGFGSYIETFRQQRSAA